LQGGGWLTQSRGERKEKRKKGEWAVGKTTRDGALRFLLTAFVGMTESGGVRRNDMGGVRGRKDMRQGRASE